MSPEKQQLLFEKYPELFTYGNDKSSRQPIAWGIECGDGWYDIIDVLCDNIRCEVKNLTYDKSPEEVEELQVRITQVKEKFGGLRFYTYGGNDRIYGMISVAESLSYRTCEGCGLPGKQWNDSWIRVLCDPCEETRKSRTSSNT